MPDAGAAADRRDLSVDPRLEEAANSPARAAGGDLSAAKLRIPATAAAATFAAVPALKIPLGRGDDREHGALEVEHSRSGVAHGRCGRHPRAVNARSMRATLANGVLRRCSITL